MDRASIGPSAGGKSHRRALPRGAGRPHNARVDWTPLLEGADAERARDAAVAVARDLERALAARPRPGLEGGRAGLAVLARYLAKAGIPSFAEVAERELGGAIELVEGGAGTGLELLPGLFGVGWATEHLAEGGDDEDGNEGIDELLLDALDGPSPFGGRLEHHTGAVGAGLYALERGPQPIAVQCVARIVDWIERAAERDGPKIRWRRPPDTLLPDQVPLYPNGLFDLGLGHGAPGLIAFLADAHAAGVARDRTRALACGAVAWLLDQRLPEDAIARFGYVGEQQGPVQVARGHVRSTVLQGAEPARLGWCYGDVGIALVLDLAGRAFSRPDFCDEALAVARKAAARPPETSGVVDAGLCHGAAGIGHMLLRLHRASGDAGLGEAARTWFRRALAMRKAEGGIGGYTFVVPSRDLRRMVEAPDPGLLNGGLGVALALLAASSDVEPRWDSLFFASFPRAVRGARA